MLKNDILAWIAEKATLAQSGDVVNIIIESHGNKVGGIVLGEYKLYPQELAKGLRDFKDEVQVNVVTGVCYGSIFVDYMRAEGQYYRYVQAAEDSGTIAYGMSRSVSGRVRNSRFSQTVCVSLAQLYLQEVHGNQRMSVGQYELSVRDQMMRNVTPNQRLTNPLSYHGAPTSLLSIVNSLIFRDAIDVCMIRQSRIGVDESSGHHSTSICAKQSFILLLGLLLPERPSPRPRLYLTTSSQSAILNPRSLTMIPQ